MAKKCPPAKIGGHFLQRIIADPEMNQVSRTKHIKGRSLFLDYKGLKNLLTYEDATPFPFTSAPIAKALLNAHKRGIKAEVILDKSPMTQRYSSATFLFNAEIATKIDAQHTIVHNKVVIIDGETVITGSFNFTKAAEENNAENLLIIDDKKLAERFTKNWQDHAQYSEVYVGRGR